MTTEERLERLERENSRLKRWGGLSLLVIAGITLMGQAAPAPKVIEATEFILRGPDGEVAGRLGLVPMTFGLGPTGIKEPALVLYRGGDLPPSVMLSGGGMPQLVLTNEEAHEGRIQGWTAKLGAIYGLLVTDTTSLDPSHPLRRVWITPDNIAVSEATVREIEERKKEVERQIASGEVAKDVGASMRRSVEFDSYRKTIEVDSSPSLRLLDKSGSVRAILGVTELETTKTGATEKTAPSSLVLFDKDGKVIERLPK